MCNIYVAVPFKPNKNCTLCKCPLAWDVKFVQKSLNVANAIQFYFCKNMYIQKTQKAMYHH